MKKILFVCTGNTCRSPMAMAVFNKLASDGIIKNAVADSAGVFANGEPLSRNADEVLKINAIDISNYISKRVTKNMLDNADKIFVMSEQHRQLLAPFVSEKEKLSVLGSGISDPYGGDLSVYKACFEQIKYEIIKLFGENKND